MNSSTHRFPFLSKPAGVLFGAGLVALLPFFAMADSTPPATDKVAVAIVSTDETVRKELLELDQRLLANPKLEEALSNNLDRLTEASFLKNNPDVATLVKQQPGAVPALKAERHFLIHRYIARRARGPLLRPDVVALDKFLSAHLEIRKALDSEPSQIVEAKFLIAHPSLGGFFDEHPSLSSVLLEAPVPKKK
jgi:hypothetical protein